jgi:hypothetical protein
MARWLRPSEHRHRIAPQPGGDQIEAVAIPSTGEPARKGERVLPEIVDSEEPPAAPPPT